MKDIQTWILHNIEQSDVTEKKEALIPGEMDGNSESVMIQDEDGGAMGGAGDAEDAERQGDQLGANQETAAEPANPVPTDGASQSKRIRTSPVWEHFEDTANPRIVQCKHCVKKVLESNLIIK